MKRGVVFAIFMVSVLLIPAADAETTITYQGQLAEEDEPFNGAVDMEFELFDGEPGNNPVSVAGPINIAGVPVSDGLFQVELDFGDAPYEDGLRLRITVDGDELNPWQPVTAAPLAIRSLSGDGNSGSNWNVVGDDISYTGGNVAIGTTHANNQAGHRLLVRGSFASGSSGNEARSGASAVVGGLGNVVASSSFDGFVGGGSNNEVRTGGGAIVGGFENLAAETRSAVIGGRANRVHAPDGFIGGGARGVVSTEADRSAILGGGGGAPSELNVIGHAARDSVIAGGVDNIIVTENFQGFIGGGGNNSVGGTRSAVVAGLNNSANSNNSFIGGGTNNTAGGNNNFIAGGRNNSTGGENSFAAGHGARALHDNSFVWSDGSSPHGAETTAENQFVVAAAGAVRFFSGDARNTGVELAPGGSGWLAVSDRDAKMAIEDVDPAEVLDRVMQMPVSEYSYTGQDESIRHMGPMAQDFHQLFALGEDELRISAMNLAGISLAAIQGLRQRLSVQEEELARRDAEISALQAELDTQRRETAERLAALEALLLDGAEVAAK